MPACFRFLLFLFAVLATRVPAVLAEETPNFILILADDMGYGDASCFENTAYKTPHLDKLAREGMRFTDFHSSGPVCSPTRAGLLTGRYQQRSGIPGVIFADPKQNRHHGLHTKEITFAELLKNAGYATGIFGKWHLGYAKPFNPVHHGFETFRGYVSGNVDYISHVDRMGIADWWNGDRLSPEDGYCTHLITKHSVDFIKANRDKPFCLYVAHEAVHSPYQGPTSKPVRAVGQGRIKKNERKDIKAAYREMMTEMDKGVGAVVATLRELKIEKNTLVIFLSDNGANRNGSNGKLRGFKGSLWEGGHRVPAIAWWPGRIKPGTVYRKPCISIDVMPTILDAARIEGPSAHRFDGVSLLGPLTGKTNATTKRTLFWAYRFKSAVRRGKWKLVVNEPGFKGRPGLFDLDADAGERKNVATEHPELVQEMLAALKAWKKDVAQGATRQPTTK